MKIALIDSPDVRRLVAVWPSVARRVRFRGKLELVRGHSHCDLLVSIWAGAAAVTEDFAWSRIPSLVNAGVCLARGAVDPECEEFVLGATRIAAGLRVKKSQ